MKWERSGWMIWHPESIFYRLKTTCERRSSRRGFPITGRINSRQRRMAVSIGLKSLTMLVPESPFVPAEFWMWERWVFQKRHWAGFVADYCRLVARNGTH